MILMPDDVLPKDRDALLFGRVWRPELMINGEWFSCGRAETPLTRKLLITTDGECVNGQAT